MQGRAVGAAAYIVLVVGFSWLLIACFLCIPALAFLLEAVGSVGNHFGKERLTIRPAAIWL